MTDQLQVGDRVVWRHPEPGADYNELHGKLTKIDPDGEAMVRWDDGSEEGCEMSDLIKETS